MPVSDWLPRPRVHLFICWLQGICTLGVVRLRRVVTCITSGVYERVHSISRRTLYYITMEYESSFRKNFNLLYTMKDAAMKSGGWWEKRASCCDAHAPYSIINESEKSHSISAMTVSRYRISSKDFRTNYNFFMQRLDQELFFSFENWIVDVEYSRVETIQENMVAG